MVNKIKYNKLPDYEEFAKLYEKMSQRELASYYSCNKTRIKKWIETFDLPLRPKGGGNNRRVSIDVHTLRNLILVEKLTDKELCIELNIKSRSTLYAWMKKYGIIREYDTTEKIKYGRRVRFLSEQNYVKYKHILNPLNKPRTMCGVEGGYQLDHIIGIADCYIKGVSPEECAHINNLQMIPWEDNLSKRVVYKIYKKEI